MKTSGAGLVRDLDRQLGDNGDFRYGTDQAIAGIMMAAVCAVMMVPAQMIPGRFEVCPYVAGIFSMASVGFRLKRYVYIRENGRTESIYCKLRFLPLGKWEIFGARVEYAVRFSLFCGGIFLIIQHLGAALNGGWSIWNVLYPVAVAAGMCLTGILYSLPLPFGGLGDPADSSRTGRYFV